MFNKKNDEDFDDNDQVLSETSAKSLRTMSQDRDDGAQSIEPSLLSAGVLIKGSISSKGPLHFHGSVEGEINAPQIRLGENGNLNGKIQCQDLSVDGVVDGEVQCSTLVAGKTAVISGTIRCESLRLQLGSQITGKLAIGAPISKK